MSFSLLTQNARDSAGITSIVLDRRDIFYDVRGVVSNLADLITLAGMWCSRRQELIGWLTVIDHGVPGGQEFGSDQVTTVQLNQYEELRKHPAINKRTGKPQPIDATLTKQYWGMQYLGRFLSPGATVLLGGCFNAVADGINGPGALMVKLSLMWRGVRVIGFDVEQVAMAPGWQGHQYTALNGQLRQGREGTFGMDNFPGRPTTPPST